MGRNFRRNSIYDCSMTLNMGIMSDIQNTYITEIPTLYMAKNIGPIVGIMFSFMLIAEYIQLQFLYFGVYVIVFHKKKQLSSHLLLYFVRL